MMSAQDLHAAFLDIRRAFDREFLRHVRLYFGSLVGTRTETREIFRAVNSLVMRDGKRLRPFLLFAGSGDMKRSMKRKQFWQAAVGLELVHTALLIHDDIVDRSPMRRGGKALHRIIGNDKAMIAADALWSLGLLCVARAHKNSMIAGEFIESLVHAGEGELLDMYFLDPRKSVRPKDVEELYLRKTGLYSCAAPLAMGAMLAGQNPRAVAQLRRVGATLGVLFQLQDDVADKDPFLMRSGVNPARYGKRLVSRVNRLLASPAIAEESRASVRYLAAMLHERIR